MINFTNPVAFTDPQGQTLTLAATGVPSFLTFVDNGNGTYTVTGTAVGSGSPWAVSIIATDTDGNTSSPHILTIDCPGPQDPVAPANITIDCNGAVI